MMTNHSILGATALHRSRERLRKKNGLATGKFRFKSVALTTICFKDVWPDSSRHIIQQGLDVNNFADASDLKLHPHFTNIEVYLNSLVKL